MAFKTYWQGLSAEQRERFASDAGTKASYCHQIAFGDKRLELGMADALVAVSGGGLTLDDLPLSARAQRQRVIRAGKPPRKRSGQTLQGAT